MSNMETIEPLGSWVLVRKDDNKSVTKGGIILPAGSETTVLTARVIAIGPAVDEVTNPFKQYDKVIVNPCRSIPVDFENKHQFLVPAEDIVGVFRRSVVKADAEHA